jgi:hypothetical protein
MDWHGCRQQQQQRESSDLQDARRQQWCHETGRIHQIDPLTIGAAFSVEAERQSMAAIKSLGVLSEAELLEPVNDLFCGQRPWLAGFIRPRWQL